MATASTGLPEHHVAHHFDSAEQEFDSVKTGMWLFLASEIMMFGALFVGALLFHTLHHGGFAEGAAHLDWKLGTVNTFFLLTSGLTMGLAVIAAILALAGKPRWAIVPGVVELALITFTFVSLYSRLSDLGSSTAAQLEGNPFKEIAGAMVKTIGFSWGWVSLYIGALMTTFHAPLVRLISRR